LMALHCAGRKKAAWFRCGWFFYPVRAPVSGGMFYAMPGGVLNGSVLHQAATGYCHPVFDILDVALGPGKHLLAVGCKPDGDDVCRFHLFSMPLHCAAPVSG